MTVQKKADTNGGCGHEQLLQKAAGKIRELLLVQQHAVDKIASLEYEKKVGTLVDRMVREGTITDEDRSEKTAELMTGKVKLAVVEQAMAMGLQPAPIPRIGVLGNGSTGDGDGFQGSDDEEMNETVQHLLSM